MTGLFAFPITDIARLILNTLPAILLSPTHALFFWLITIFVALQYRRMAEMERSLYGSTRISVWRRTLESVAHGVFGGLVASFLLVFTGVSLGETDVMFLWPVALLLMLLHPRFICFSYAATVIGLSHLALGWPQVNVAGLVGLVAILHIAEGLLVWLGGDDGAVPLYIRRPGGTVVGGFSIQRFWPVPLAALFALALPPELQGGAIAMPDWWPLVSPPAAALDNENYSLVLWPVAAALGYSDLAVREEPALRSRRSAILLLLYSLTLLGLVIAASRWAPLLWLAVIASGGLHELMIQLGMRIESGGQPRFVAPDRGVLVMDVLPGGFAESLGLRRGDVIVAVNGRQVLNRQGLKELLQEAPFYLELTVLRDNRQVTLETHRFHYAPGMMGFVPAPEPHDAPQVHVGGGGILQRWLGRLAAALGRGTKWRS